MTGMRIFKNIINHKDPMSGNLPFEQMNVIEKNPSFYNDREGYDSNFLEETIPLPNLSDPMIVDCVKLKNSDDHELKYTNFSVVMSKSRCLAFFTAVNIDGSKLKKLDREKDAWYFDPRIDKKYQYGPEVYSKNDLDRGHLVRRLDPVWGDNYVDANEDTFHFTNCSPQHKDLNQKTWLKLEDYVLKNADLHDLKVNVFTGPVFRKDDMLYKDHFLIPADFWKVVTIIKKDGNISATAYLQTQKKLIDGLKFVYGKYETYQVQINTIASFTGLDFGNLNKFDPMTSIKAPSIIIGKPSDIIL